MDMALVLLSKQVLSRIAACRSRRRHQFGWRDAPSTWGGSHKSFGPRKTKTAIEIANAKGSHFTVKDVAEQFHRWRSARDLSTINPREEYNS